MCEVGIPAKAGTQSHHPSFPRRRESNPIIRHSREGGNPTPSSVIPAKAGIQPHHPSFPRRREPNPIIRHSREGGNPHPSFPRRREPNPIIRHSREGGNPIPSSVIPAKAGIHNSRACGNSSSSYPNARKKILRHSHESGNDVEVVLCRNDVSGRSGWCFR